MELKEFGVEVVVKLTVHAGSEKFAREIIEKNKLVLDYAGVSVVDGEYHVSCDDQKILLLKER